MNSFFAVEVSPEAQQYIQENVVRLWKPALRDNLRWYLPQEYHVTLKFLGNVSEEQEQSVIAAAVPVAAQISPFMLTLAPPGAFPLHRSKQVFWMGVGKNQNINGLAASLDHVCREMGFQRDDRLYTPHITVARIPRGKGHESDSNAPLVSEQVFPYWQVSRFVLMQTLPLEKRAKDSKARYNIVHTFPFGNASAD